MSNLTEGTIILKTIENNYGKGKKSYERNNVNNLLYFLIFILILINIGTLIYLFTKINFSKLINIISDKNANKLLKLINDSNERISFLEKELLIKNHNTSIHQLYNFYRDIDYQIESFDKGINELYKKSQYYFCNNQNIFYIQKFEDKIKLIDIKFENISFNMFVYRTGDIVSNSLIKSKSWELDETLKLLKALHFYSNKKNINNNDIYIIDIGANIGWYSFIFGYYGYKVISFEPSKINNYILKKNFCLNKEINLTIINKGLYDEEKKCFLYNQINNEGNGFVNCELNQNLTNSFKKTGEIILTKLSTIKDC